MSAVRLMFKDEHSWSLQRAQSILGVEGILLVLLVFAFSLTLPVAAAEADPGDLLPDLVADQPTNAQAPVVQQLSDGQNHLLLKFNGSIHNIGAGPLEIRGSNPVNGEMTVTEQRIYQQVSPPIYRDDFSRHPILHFENTDGHNHWHLMSAARWSLWNEAGNVQVAPAAKVGFCLEDGEPVDSFAVPSPPPYLATTTQR